MCRHFQIRPLAGFNNCRRCFVRHESTEESLSFFQIYGNSAVGGDDIAEQARFPELMRNTGERASGSRDNLNPRCPGKV